MSLERRKLSVNIYIGGNTGGAASKVISLDGYRMVANIVSNGGMATGQAQLRVYGMPLSQINELTTIQLTPTHTKTARSILEIYAGEGDKSPSLAFRGLIWWAWGDFQSAPDTSFVIHCQAYYDLNLTDATPTTVKGSIAAADLVKQLASRAGLGFQNDGVSAILNNPYHEGSPLRQMRQIQKAGNFNLEIDRSVVYIWPKDGHRKGAVPVVGPGNKLVGYVTQSAAALSVRTEYLPEAKLGGNLTIQGSQLPVANGTWHIRGAIHSLSAEMPGGPWFSDIECSMYPNI